MVTLKGYNEFYEGWLARLFHQPDSAKQTAAWRVGWDTANEVGDLAVGALLPEIREGHITVA